MPTHEGVACWMVCSTRPAARARLARPCAVGPAGHVRGLESAGSGAAALRLLSGLRGAFIPLPATAAAGARAKDPRRSIAERYVGLDGYMAMVEHAIEAQVAAGFLLPQDREQARTTMRTCWDRVARLRVHWPLRAP